MAPIHYLDRVSGQIERELVYGASALSALYGTGKMGWMVASLLAKFPWFSKWYGKLQDSAYSRRKVLPFIRRFGLDIHEFLDPPESFCSFNEFFYRKLKPEARPIHPGEDTAIIPADGRYLFYPKISEADGFVVKGKKFCLTRLLKDARLAEEYIEGSLVIARLCPSDYHRFHFPFDCQAGESALINGSLFSVNPMALLKYIEIFSENKRTLCILSSSRFGKVLYLDIGALFVGAIHQTYTPYTLQTKGAEKGFFSFGGSSLLLLFPPNKIQFDAALLKASSTHLEIKCLMGQSMGIACSS